MSLRGGARARGTELAALQAAIARDDQRIGDHAICPFGPQGGQDDG
jgi:hypothetical protein